MASELEMRTCGRAGCRWPAAASLSFRYDTRQVWLVDLVPQPHPSLYDLCPHHADTLTVPRGWDRVDEREHQEAVREPSGKDLVARMERQPEPAHAVASNRYAALSEDLPRLAQEYGAPATTDAGDSSTDGATEDSSAQDPGDDSSAEGGGDDSSAEGAAGGAATPSGATEVATTDVVPARDLAPLPIGEPVTAPSPRDTERPSEPVPETGEHPGQLAIPVDALDDAEPGDAIVVSIETAGARRRDR